MSTITLDVSPTTARRLADDPEALRLLAAMAEEVFGGPTKLVVSNELYASFLEVIDGVEAGTIKTKPHSKEEAMARAEELLRREIIS